MMLNCIASTKAVSSTSSRVKNSWALMSSSAGRISQAVSNQKNWNHPPSLTSFTTNYMLSLDPPQPGGTQKNLEKSSKPETLPTPTQKQYLDADIAVASRPTADYTPRACVIVIIGMMIIVAVVMAITTVVAVGAATIKYKIKTKNASCRNTNSSDKTNTNGNINQTTRTRNS